MSNLGQSMVAVTRMPFRMVLVSLLLFAIVSLLLIMTVGGSPASQGSVYTSDNHRSDLDVPLDISSMEREVLEPTGVWSDWPLVVADADGDGHPEIYIRWGGHLQRYDTGNRTFEELPLSVSGTPQLQDVDGDGHVELVHYDQTDGHYHVVDLTTWEEEWRTPAGGQSPEQPKVFTTSSGERRFLIATDVDELTLLTGSGDVVWRREVAGTEPYPRIAVADLDLDGRLEFVVVSLERRGMERTIVVTVGDVSSGGTSFEWRSPAHADGGISTPPLVADIVRASRGLEIAIGRDGGAIWVISGADGGTLWTRPDQASYVQLRAFETVRHPNGTYLVSLAREYLDVLWGETGRTVTHLNTSLSPVDLGDIMLVDDLVPDAPGEELCYVDSHRLLVYNPVINETLWVHVGSDDTRGVRFLLLRSEGGREFALHVLTRDIRTERTEHTRYFVGLGSGTQLVPGGDACVMYPNVTNTIDGLDLVDVEGRLRSVVLVISYQEELARITYAGPDVTVRNYVDYLRILDASIQRTDGSDMTVAFEAVVDWDVDDNVTYDVMVAITLADGTVSVFQLEGYLVVEKRIMVQGTLEAYDNAGSSLEEGQWFTGWTSVLLTGPRVLFLDSSIPPNPVDLLALGSGGVPTDETIAIGADGDLDWRTMTPSMENGIVEWTIEIAAVHTGQSITLRFGLAIDGAPPEFLALFPEDGIWTSEPEPLVGCLATDGNGSGVHRVEFQYGRDLSSMGEWSPVDLIVGEEGAVEALMEQAMEDGTWSMRWRLFDLAGNGPVLSDARTLSIDRTGVTFDARSPTGWVTSGDVLCSVLVEDLQGSGVDGATVRYTYSTGGPFSFGDWTDLGLVEVAESILVEVQLSLPEGVDNLVMVRASDVAGNERVSKPFTIRVDATLPSLSGPWPSNGTVLDNGAEVEASVNVTDGLSGVASVAYRTRTDDGAYSEWSDAVWDAGTGEATCRFAVDGGLTVSLQWSALDVAGNPSTSFTLVYRVNQPPVIDGLEPASPHRVHAGREVVFSVDASDPEGDAVTVEWSIGGEVMGNGTGFARDFPEGRHRVIVSVDDGHGNVVEAKVVVIAEEEPSFTVGPLSILPWVVLVVIIVAIAAYQVQRRRSAGGSG